MNYDRELELMMEKTQKQEVKVSCMQCGAGLSEGMCYYEIYNEVFCEDCKDDYLEEIKKYI